MSSLRSRLIAVWLLLLGAAAAIGIVFLAFYQQTTATQAARASDLIARACADIQDRSAFLMNGWAGPSNGVVSDDLKKQLTGAVVVALAKSEGVEGGLWSAGQGSLAYAFPTYPGTGPKTDIPEAELGSIREINATARLKHALALGRRPAQSQMLLLAACPVDGPIPDLTAWTMTRLYTGTGAAYRKLLAGLGLLAGVVVLSAGLLGWIIWAWSRRIRMLEMLLATGDDGEDPPPLPLTGERELDRLVKALNAARARLADAYRRAATAERYAVAGRLAASIAHEIRNPIAAMRLKAENAVASDDPSRKEQALLSILSQIGRLDALLRDLLAMTQRREPQREPTDIDSLVARALETVGERAAAGDVRLDHKIDPAIAEAGPPSIDGAQIVRALENLLVNAVQHTPPGGIVQVEAKRNRSLLCLAVTNTGSTVCAGLRDHLFEPFVTGRRDGTGLGLAIVSEIAAAHGGRARLASAEEPVTFEIEVPWNAPQS